MCKDILKECGWQLPEELLGADVEIYFKDKYGVIQARLGDEPIRWNSRGVCMTHTYELVPIEKMWYEYPENFPCICYYSTTISDVKPILLLGYSTQLERCYDEKNFYLMHCLKPARTVGDLTQLSIKKGRVC